MTRRNFISTRTCREDIHSRNIMLRCTVLEHETLKQTAAFLECSVSDLLREAVRHYFDTLNAARSQIGRKPKHNRSRTTPRQTTTKG